MIEFTGADLQIRYVLHDAINHKWNFPSGVIVKFYRDEGKITVDGLAKTKQEILDAVTWYNTNLNSLTYNEKRKKAFMDNNKILWDMAKALYAWRKNGNTGPLDTWVAQVDALITQFPSS